MESSGCRSPASRYVLRTEDGSSSSLGLFSNVVVMIHHSSGSTPCGTCSGARRAEDGGFLGGPMREVLGGKLRAGIVRAAFTFVGDEGRRFASLGNETLRSRYFRLHAYMQAGVARWAGEETSGERRRGRS